jgi:hypothetical protein
MTTYDHLANSQHATAFKAETTSGFRGAGDSRRLFNALRSYVTRGVSRSKARLGSDNGLEADTRQIRSFDLSKLSGACEVRLGFA